MIQYIELYKLYLLNKKCKLISFRQLIIIYNYIILKNVDNFLVSNNFSSIKVKEFEHDIV